MSTARENALARASDALESAVAGLVSGEDWRRAVEFAARFRSRSFANSLLIWVQHEQAFAEGRVPDPMPTFVAGYRQWEELGRHANQPGYVIQAPRTARVAVPATGGELRMLARGEKPNPGEVVQTRMVGVKPVYVWDVSQTTGAPIPEPPRPVLLEGEAPAGLWNGLAARVAAAGYTLSDVPSATDIHGANGVTSFAERTVRVRVDMDAAARVKTLAHELGHVLLHDPEEDAGPPHRGVGEVEAESFALMVCASYGLSTQDYSVPYVAGWAAKVEGVEPAQLVRALGEKVRAAVLGVLDQLPEPTTGDGTPPGLERDPDSPTRRAKPPAPRPTRRPAPRAEPARMGL